MKTPKQIITAFEKVRKEDFGARFYRVDLHFHTPASEDARGRNKYNFNPFRIKYPKNVNSPGYLDKVRKMQEKILLDAREVAKKIVDRFVEERLSLVAVTDHNSIGTIWPDNEFGKSTMDLAAPTWYEIIDDEAQKINNEAGKTVLTILPGAEISTTGIHILAIFPPQQPRRTVHFLICDLLSEVGFTVEEWGRNPSVGKASVYNTIELITKKGGVPIIAHADGSDQALLKLYKINSGAMKNVYKNKHLSAIEIVKPSRFMKKNKKLKKPVSAWINLLRDKEGLASLAYFQGSDAHALKDIAKRSTFVKMTEPSFAGFKIAIKIPSSRVRLFDDHKPEVNGLFIYGVAIDDKYLGKRFVRFNRHLNCVVGKMEAGKSLFFGLMKKVVNNEPVTAKGSITLFIEKMVDSVSNFYAISKEYKDASICLYSINKDDNSSTKLDAGQLKDLEITPRFYDAGIVNKLISKNKNLNGFLSNHFGDPTKQNIKDFNKLFSIPNFLEEKEEQLLHVENKKGEYRLYLNINWNKGKEKKVEFSKLTNSQKRIVLVCIILIGGRTGPLIIDQAESNFDNEDIVRFLIPVIKKYKNTRQIIISTGNPILAINSDPENYIILERGVQKLNNLRSGFSIDKKEQKEQLINIMEGSEREFNKRVIRYGIGG